MRFRSYKPRNRGYEINNQRIRNKINRENVETMLKEYIF